MVDATDTLIMHCNSICPTKAQNVLLKGLYRKGPSTFQKARPIWAVEPAFINGSTQLKPKDGSCVTQPTHLPPNPTLFMGSLLRGFFCICLLKVDGYSWRA